MTFTFELKTKNKLKTIS